MAGELVHVTIISRLLNAETIQDDGVFSSVKGPFPIGQVMQSLYISYY